MKTLRFLAVAGALIGGSLSLTALEKDEARHLLARTGFGGTPGEIESLLPMTREQAIDAIIASTRTVARTKAPEFCYDELPAYLNKRRSEYDAAEKISNVTERDKKQNELRGIRDKWGRELKAWWYQEMITTDSPLTERMTLFWANHFTSSLRAIEEPRLMYEQNVLLRQYALDNFAFMLKEINTDPAMFRYLDSNSNVAGRPNENYAREVMELFTLGEGKYTENDIKEAARAFTGYKIDDKTGRAALQEGPHDGGWKTIMGHKGAYTGDDVIKILLLSEERVAIYVAEKFWKEFISDTLDSKAVYKLAGTFYRGKYDIKKLLRATLLAEQFWDPANRGTLFKSPVEFVVGSARLLQLPIDDYYGYADLGRRLGQDIMDPPNVKGWSGSTAWISTESLLSRWEITDNLLSGKIGQGQDIGSMMAMPAPAAKPEATKEPSAKKEAKKDDAKKEDDKPALSLLPKPWVSDAKAKGAEGVDLAISILLPLPPVDEIGKGNLDQALRQILHDPTYNLK